MTRPARLVLLASLCSLLACTEERDDDGNAAPGITSPVTTASGTGGQADDGGDETGEKLDIGGGGTGQMTGGDGTAPVGSCEEAAQNASNQGCEFWAVDLPNAWAGINGSPAPADQQFAVVVANTASEASASVQVFNGVSGAMVETTSVPPGQIHEFRLPALNQEPRANTYGGQSYRVESDVPITAYQFNPLDNTVQVFSNDASLLFPTPVLDTDYTAITGNALWLSTDAEPNGDNAGAFVSVVATEDATTVDLFATWGLYAGDTQGVTLNRGEVFTAVSVIPGANMGDGSLSGSRVVADKPVAVFAGNVATLEPNPGQCCADHLEQQMLPLVAWGDSYLAAPPPSPTVPGEIVPAAYRITGSFDGTTLTYSPAPPPGAPTTINAGETVRFETNLPFTVTSGDPEQSFALTQFLLSSQALGGAFSSQGDPAMISLPAAAQYQEDYIFLVPDGYASNYVTVVRQQGASVERDGVSVDAAGWMPLGVLDGVGYEYVHLAVETGSHRVVSDQPCGIVSVGYDQDVSYGYPGGSGLEVISTPPPPPVG
ncbi:MAG: IgGFc-binding protein [Myxococcota bacterium]